MRIAIISDIHGNLEAFEQVLEDIDHCRVDKTICLGDNVGYGPEPDRVVRLLQARGIESVMGNHELAIVDGKYLKWFNPPTRESLRITRNLLDRETVDYITRMRSFLVNSGALFVHGCPPDSMTTYLFQLSDAELEAIFLRMEQDMCFVGHTHNLSIVSFDGERIHRSRPGKGLFPLETGKRYIVNAGSVGQPRDGNNNAKYVIWDAAGRTLEVRFVPYDIGVTAGKILQSGFPEFNATRLW